MEERQVRSRMLATVVGVALVAAAVGCVGEEPKTGTTTAKLSYSEFLTKLPDAVCDHYLRCGRITAEERPACAKEIYDDVERDYSCNAARGLYSDLAESLSTCVTSKEMPCGRTDDLDVFCANLRLLEDECRPAP
jgi:hypothetical protein